MNEIKFASTKEALQFLADKTIHRSYLGIEYIDLNMNLKPLLKQNGALITSTKKDSPLKETPINVNDVILKINDNILNGSKNLTDTVQQYSTGDKIKITAFDYQTKQEKVVEVQL